MRGLPIMRAAFSLERPDATSSLNARRSLLVVPCMALPMVVVAETTAKNEEENEDQED